MAEDTQIDIRAEVVAMLLDKITEDRNPSVAMLDMVELLADAEERSRYAEALLDKVTSSRHPSIPMMRRLVALS